MQSSYALSKDEQIAKDLATTMEAADRREQALLAKRNEETVEAMLQEDFEMEEAIRRSLKIAEQEGYALSEDEWEQAPDEGDQEEDQEEGEEVNESEVASLVGSNEGAASLVDSGAEEEKVDE